MKAINGTNERVKVNGKEIPNQLGLIEREDSIEVTSFYNAKYKELKKGEFYLLESSLIKSRKLPFTLYERFSFLEETVFNRFVFGDSEKSNAAFYTILDKVWLKIKQLEQSNIINTIELDSLMRKVGNLERKRWYQIWK